MGQFWARIFHEFFGEIFRCPGNLRDGKTEVARAAFFSHRSAGIAYRLLRAAGVDSEWLSRSSSSKACISLLLLSADSTVIINEVSFASDWCRKPRHTQK